MNYDYPNNLGRLIANINSLEVEIRFFLLIDEYGWEKANQWAKSLLTLEAGQNVVVNPFTNYDKLNVLIGTYNKKVKKLSKLPGELTISDKIVDLRNALAHGRAFFSVPNTPPMILLAFDNPKGHKQTKLLSKDTMTRTWLVKNIKWADKEKQKVIVARCRIKTIKP
jgi:hypothetical protein